MALAEHVGGSIEGFAQMMNNKAKELGLENTHFVTPHGLDENEHYTTAYELAKLTDYALGIKKFSTIVNTKTATIHINSQEKILNNTNELLGNLNGVDGVKTGFTNNAGRCLVTSTTRNSHQIICVVLGADTKKIRTEDSIKLIEYAFANYKYININEKIQNEFKKWKNKFHINVIKGEEKNIDFILDEIPYTEIPIKKSDENAIQVEITCENTLQAPVEQGKQIRKIATKYKWGKYIRTQYKNKRLYR